MASRVAATLLVALLASALVSAQDPSRSSVDLAQQARDVLKKHCAGCHSTEAKKIKGGIDYMLDLRKLRVASATNGKLVNTSQPDASLILKLVRSTDADTRMPPDGTIGKDDISTLERWIITGARIVDDTVARPFLSNEDIISAVLDHIQKDTRIDKTRAKHNRYLTLTHLHNDNPQIESTDLQLYRAGLAKLVNSLTWTPSIIPLLPVPGTRDTVYCINLVDYGWHVDHKWNTLIEHYPYAQEFREQDYKALTVYTDGNLPIVRADWFAFAAAQPPFYHSLLGLPDHGPNLRIDPKDRADRRLEKTLGLDILNNLREDKATRAGVLEKKSGVSANNRLIERHEISPNRAYWISYDFKSNAGLQHLISHPLGPVEAKLSRNKAFEHNGGEIIFNLPNGLQAYLLTDALGTRLDDAPPEIVRNLSNPSSPLIINGISCIECHTKGMRTMDPQPFLDALNVSLPSLTDPERRHAQQLFVDAVKLESTFVADSKVHNDAANRAVSYVGGIPADKDLTKGKESREPVRALFDRFTENVRLSAAAAELGLTESDFLARAKLRNVLSVDLIQLQADGIARERFVETFKTFLSELGLANPKDAKPAPFPFWHKIGPHIPEADKLSINDLYRAIERSDVDLAAKCLAQGLRADSVNQSRPSKDTPLHFAAREAGIDLFKLLSAKANIDVKDGAGRTPLFGATLNEKRSGSDIVQHLIDCKAEVNVKSEYGDTPVLVAAEFGSSSILSILVKAGADVNVQDKDGRTALIIVSLDKKQNLEGARILLNTQGINLDRQEATKGYSALHLAALNGHVKLVEMLLRKGIDKDLETDKGNTALQLVRSRIKTPLRKEELPNLRSIEELLQE